MRIRFCRIIGCATLVSVLLTGLGSCIEIPHEYSAIPPGIWRGTLILASESGSAREAFDEETGGILPFNFEVIYDRQDSFHIELINGDERIIIDDIRFGRDRRISKDTIYFEFPGYDSYVRARYEEDAIEGDWYAPNRGTDYAIPFKARHGKDQRFSFIAPPELDFTGKWDVTFKPDQSDSYHAVGVFSQDSAGIVTGTFLTNTGDYRFLEGKASGHRLFLSVFDGSHAYLFESKAMEDGSMAGSYRSGNHYKVYWHARRTDSVELDNPYSLTAIADSAQAVDFTFTNINGQPVSLSDQQYQGIPKVIQLMGTWCPNCRDETEFLGNYRKTHPEKSFGIVALAFERHRDPDLARRAIRKYIDHFGLDYEVLYVGNNNKDEAGRMLPFLGKVVSFPTLVFLDRNNRVVATHTGFNGPATDKYEQFSREFDVLIDSLINAQ